MSLSSCIFQVLHWLLPVMVPVVVVLVWRSSTKTVLNVSMCSATIFPRCSIFKKVAPSISHSQGSFKQFLLFLCFSSLVALSLGKEKNTNSSSICYLSEIKRKAERHLSISYCSSDTSCNEILRRMWQLTWINHGGVSRIALRLWSWTVIISISICL